MLSNCPIVVTNDCTLMDIIRYSMHIFLKPRSPKSITVQKQEVINSQQMVESRSAE